MRKSALYDNRLVVRNTVSDTGLNLSLANCSSINACDRQYHASMTIVKITCNDKFASDNARRVSTALFSCDPTSCGSGQRAPIILRGPLIRGGVFIHICLPVYKLMKQDGSSGKLLHFVKHFLVYLFQCFDPNEKHQLQVKNSRKNIPLEREAQNREQPVF